LEEELKSRVEFSGAKKGKAKRKDRESAVRIF